MANEKTPEVVEKSNKRVAFQVMEAYKMIRTNLMFSLATKNSRAVVFSSAEPSAGKSTLSANLAIVMAQTGARVLLIDADMRKPTQHRNFQLSRTMGLSKILGGLATVEECLHKNAKPNVDVILSGPTPPNPSELLGSARMSSLLEEMGKQYDYIFIDMPPLCVVADALVVAPMAAGVVLVARHNQTMYEEFSEALEKVEQAGAALLGEDGSVYVIGKLGKNTHSTLQRVIVPAPMSYVSLNAYGLMMANADAGFDYSYAELSSALRPVFN